LAVGGKEVNAKRYAQAAAVDRAEDRGRINNS